MTKTKNPPVGSHDGRASVSCALDAVSLTEKHSEPQHFDDLARYRAMILLQRFAMQPETAVALAAVVFGGGQ
jgi:hypothetical protein